MRKKKKGGSSKPMVEEESPPIAALAARSAPLKAGPSLGVLKSGMLEASSLGLDNSSDLEVVSACSGGDLSSSEDDTCSEEDCPGA